MEVGVALNTVSHHIRCWPAEVSFWAHITPWSIDTRLGWAWLTPAAVLLAPGISILTYSMENKTIFRPWDSLCTQYGIDMCFSVTQQCSWGGAGVGSCIPRSPVRGTFGHPKVPKLPLMKVRVTIVDHYIMWLSHQGLRALPVPVYPPRPHIKLVAFSQSSVNARRVVSSMLLKKVLTNHLTSVRLGHNQQTWLARLTQLTTLWVFVIASITLCAVCLTPSPAEHL